LADQRVVTASDLLQIGIASGFRRVNGPSSPFIPQHKASVLRDVSLALVEPWGVERYGIRYSVVPYA
jgi:hypothetical protein